MICDHQPTMPQLLANYASLWLAQANLYFGHSLEQEKERHLKFTTFFKHQPELFCRNHLPGHFTGSTLVTNNHFDHVLLTYHRKLRKWLQLGGHADGHTDIAAVALREAQEESGLKSFAFVDLAKIFKLKLPTLIPYDLDCHYIPQRPEMAGHYHYDIIFLLTTNQNMPLEISSESIDLRWFALEEALQLTQEEAAVQRLLYKLKAVKAQHVL